MDVHDVTLQDPWKGQHRRWLLPLWALNRMSAEKHCLVPITGAQTADLFTSPLRQLWRDSEWKLPGQKKKMILLVDVYRRRELLWNPHSAAPNYRPISHCGARLIVAIGLRAITARFSGESQSN